MKYIVEANEYVQMISLIGVREGTAITITGNVETFQTADKAIDEAYQKGFEAGQHEATTLEYQQGLEEGKKQARAQAHLDVCHDIERVAHGNYQKGLNDAWECARKLFSEMSDTEINLVFPQEWNNGGFKALMALHPQDAIDRIKAYEDRQKLDEIKVGDEVRNTLGTMDNAVGYFFGDSSDGCYKVLRYVDGKFKTGIWNKENCERTGKHSDAVERMVAVMKAGAE